MSKEENIVTKLLRLINYEDFIKSAKEEKERYKRSPYFVREH